MKGFVTAVVASLMLFFHPNLEAIPKLPFKSVQAIQHVNDDSILTTICSSFSINKAKGYWATANHCAAESQTVAKGMAIVYVLQDPKADIAVYQANHAEALHIARDNPQVGDDVVMIGYPYGSLDPVPFFGRVSGLGVRLTNDMTHDLFNILGLPGNSGGPIIDNSGRVVGLAQQSTQGGAAHNTPLDIIRIVLAPYVE